MVIFNLLSKVEPKSGIQTEEFNENLQGLRGIAVLSVMLFHAFSCGILDFYIIPEWLNCIPVGSIFVYMFFILSGYVMGITYNTVNSFSTKAFLLKRMIRLYPIYLFTVLLLVFTNYEASY